MTNKTTTEKLRQIEATLQEHERLAANAAQLNRIERALACSFAAEAYQEMVAEDRNAKIANAAVAFVGAFEQLKSVAGQV